MQGAIGASCANDGGHSMRVGTLSWSNNLLASGSRDRMIYVRDAGLLNHFQESLLGCKRKFAV